MLKDIADHKEPQRFKDLPTSVFFRLLNQTDTIYYSFVSFKWGNEDVNAFRLVESEYNHGHSHSYDLRPVFVEAETQVERIEIIKIDIEFKRM